MMNAQLIGLSREIALRRELDVIANNMANMNTNGFQAERVAFEDYMMPRAEASAFETRDHDLAYVHDWATYRDTSAGGRVMTGNPLDVALSPGGYLTVETPQGVAYTRNGALQINDEGFLVNHQGLAVLGEGNLPIQLSPNDADVAISADGTVSTDQGVRGRLTLAGFQNEQELEKAGFNLYRTEAAPDPNASVTLTSGVIERSNVEPIREMARLIEVQRAYEMQSRMVRDADQMRQQAIRQLGSMSG